MLGCFIGHAPGVTLPAVGIYGAVVEVPSGLRKVNQALIRSSRRCGGNDSGRGTGTCRRRFLALRMDALILLPSAVMACWLGHPQHLWAGVSTGRDVARHRRARLRHELPCRPRRDRHHGARPGSTPNSAITCVIALAANVWLINRFGMAGAALAGAALRSARILRHRALQQVWLAQPWSKLGPPARAPPFRNGGRLPCDD